MIASFGAWEQEHVWCKREEFRGAFTSESNTDLYRECQENRRRVILASPPVREPSAAYVRRGRK